MLIKDILNEREWYQAVNLNSVPSKPGAYLIQTPDNRRYVGSSVCLKDRLTKHNFGIGRGYSNPKWYCIAKNTLRWKVKRIDPPIMPKEVRELPPPPKLSVPMNDPREELAKDGRPKGKRASKKLIQTYEKLYVEAEKKYYSELRLYEKTYSRALALKESYQRKVIYYERKINKLDIIADTNIKVYFCPCEDYGNYEDRILKAIKDNKQEAMYYNSKYYSNNLKESDVNEL